MALKKNEVQGLIVAALFLSGEAVEVGVFGEMARMDDDEIDVIVQEMIVDMELRESGILLKRIGDKIQLCTNPKYAAHLKELFAPVVPEALTQSVLETLSIIAYRQPLTRAEIDETRGVHSNYAVAALKEKGLVKEIGRKDVLGRPALLGTTDEFLRHFGISSLDELPKIDFSAGQGEQLEMDAGGFWL